MHKKNKCLFALLVIFSLIVLNSCMYKMPTEDAFSVIPNTNNPKIFKEDQDAASSLPKLAY